MSREIHVGISDNCVAFAGDLERHDASLWRVAVAECERRRTLRRRPPHRHVQESPALGIRGGGDRSPDTSAAEHLLIVAEAGRLVSGVEWSAPPSALASSRYSTASLAMVATSVRPWNGKTTGPVDPRSRSLALRYFQFDGVNESTILNSFGASVMTVLPKLPAAGSYGPSAVCAMMPLGPLTTPPRPQAPAGLPAAGVETRQARMGRIAHIHGGDVGDRSAAATRGR